MPVPVIQINGLTKIYKGELGEKSTIGLDALDLTVEQGGVYAFIGPNGAGKTTAIRLILRLIFPSAGSISLFGQPLKGRELLHRVGYLPEQPQLYAYLSGREFLHFIGQLFDISKDERIRRVDALISQVGLEERADGLIRGYSRGMMQRLGLAQALINDPELIILDEPMASLDPVGRKDFRDLILQLRDRGKTIFFSSHILADAEIIADRIAMLNKGRLVQEGDMARLLKDGVKAVELIFDLPAEHINILRIDEERVIQQGSYYRAILPDIGLANEMAARIWKKGGSIISIIPQQHNLESLFLKELGRQS